MYPVQIGFGIFTFCSSMAVKMVPRFTANADSFWHWQTQVCKK